MRPTVTEPQSPDDRETTLETVFTSAFSLNVEYKLITISLGFYGTSVDGFNVSKNPQV